MECRIRRNRLGSLCGYVCIPPEHPLYGVSANDLPDLDVHGGVTWAGSWQDDEDDRWWIGFDCGHAFDLSPGMHRAWRSGVPAIPISPDDVYRNVEYAANETRKLAEQLLRPPTP
jgi:hypothetical protein